MPLINILIRKNLNLESIVLFFFLTFPIALILGNLIINFYIVITGLIYLFTIKENLLKNNIFILLFLFFISLLINLIFTQNFGLSYQRVLKFIFVIFFVLSFQYLINLNKAYDKIIYKTWFFILLIVTIDLLIEFYFGQNSLGMKSYMPGRLAGFFDDELVIGYFYLGFVFLCFGFIYKKYTSNKTLIFGLYFFIVFISLIIGERSNLVKLFIGISIMMFLIFEVNFLKKAIISLLIVIISVSFILNNQNYKIRYYEQIKLIFQPSGLDQYLKSSEYGAHYNTAYKMFLNNKLFGVGIKNYRVETFKEEYRSDEYKYSRTSVKTHPHQIHFEFLAETGFFGYFSFLIFIFCSLFLSIKSYIKFRNIYQLAAIIFILMSLVPYLPSGSFFSTFNSSIFWLNYAIMMGYVNYKAKF